MRRGRRVLPASSRRGDGNRQEHEARGLARIAYVERANSLTTELAQEHPDDAARVRRHEPVEHLGDAARDPLVVENVGDDLRDAHGEVAGEDDALALDVDVDVPGHEASMKVVPLNLAYSWSCSMEKMSTTPYANAIA